MILYTFNDGNLRKHTDVVVHPDRYISVNGNEPTPFEDYGDCTLRVDDVPVEEAFEDWLNQTGVL